MGHGSIGGGGFRGGSAGGFGGARSSVGNYGGFRGGIGFSNGYRGGYGGYGYGRYGYGGYGYRGYGYRGYYGGYWPYGWGLGWGYPWGYGFWPDYYDYYSYPYAYDPNGYGYQSYDPNVTVVYPPPQQAAPATYSETARSVTHSYDQYGQEVQPAGNTTSSPVYLIALKSGVIEAAASYWVNGDTLHYVSLQHEEKQTPVESIDRALTNQLNRERHVTLNLPAGK